MRQRFIYLHVIFFSFSLNCYGEQFQTDSAYNAVMARPDDSFKVRELTVLSHKIASYNPKQAVQLARYIIEIAVKIHDELGKGIGYNELGHAFERHSVNDSAFYYFFSQQIDFQQVERCRWQSSGVVQHRELA